MVKHDAIQLIEHVQLIRQFKKILGPQDAACWVMPARQSFAPRNSPGRKVDLGLKIGNDLSPLHRILYLVQSSQSAVMGGAKRMRVPRDTVAPERFGVIKRDIGTSDQITGRNFGIGHLKTDAGPH